MYSYDRRFAATKPPSLKHALGTTKTITESLEAAELLLAQGNQNEAYKTLTKASLLTATLDKALTRVIGSAYF